MSVTFPVWDHDGWTYRQQLTQNVLSQIRKGGEVVILEHDEKKDSHTGFAHR